MSEVMGGELQPDIRVTVIGPRPCVGLDVTAAWALGAAGAQRR